MNIQRSDVSDYVEVSDYGPCLRDYKAAAQHRACIRFSFNHDYGRRSTLGNLSSREDLAECQSWDDDSQQRFVEQVFTRNPTEVEKHSSVLNFTILARPDGPLVGEI